MAKLNRIAMDLIYKSNKPENLKGVIDKGYAFDYANYLVEKGLELPEVIVDYIASLKWGDKVFSSTNKSKIVDLSIKIKEKGKDLPDAFIEAISNDETYLPRYISDLLARQLYDKIEPQIYEKVASLDGYQIRRLLLKMEEEGVLSMNYFPVHVLNIMLEKLSDIGSGTMEGGYDEDTAFFCVEILESLINVRAITSFKQIDQRTLYVIFKKKDATEFFANILLKNKIKDLPKELDEIINEPMPTVHSDTWNKRTKRMADALINYKKSTNEFQESFASWFKKRN